MVREGNIVPAWVNRRLGFRGTSLLFLSLVWVAIGTRVAYTDASPGYSLPLEYLPTSVRMALWYGAAAVAVMAAFWPPGRTKWGFVALTVPVSFRALSYAGAAGLEAFTGDPWQAARLAVEALLWAGITGYVVNTANWPEPPCLDDGVDQESHR